MTGGVTQGRIAELAEALLDARDRQQQMAPFSETEPGFSMADAKAISLRIRSLRLATGEAPRGRKIGFTNRTIWEKYDITGPIWGDIFDDTLTYLDGAEATVALPALTEPRIEPEIVFGFRTAPEASMTDADLCASVDWVAHGFEVVMSPFPGWRFKAPDCMAAFGLHGALYVGPRHPLADLGPDPVKTLSGLTVDLWNGDEKIGTGRGEYVLGGPVQALRFLLEELAKDPSQPPLEAGDVVTTGALLDGIPMQAGERWRTEIHGAPLEGLDLRFT